MKFKNKMEIIRNMRGLFNSKFLKGDEEVKFAFVKKYLRILEEFSESLNNVFYDTDPTTQEERKNESADMDKECLDFLVGQTKATKIMLFNDNLSAMAHCFMGIVYEIGAFGLRQDLQKAIAFYRAAARQNNSLGTFRLAQCFERGNGLQKNHKKAITFYRCAAKLGGVEALHTYGIILLQGELGLVNDTSSGLFYLKLAVKGAGVNYPYPYYDLGKFYEIRQEYRGSSHDVKYAFSLYEKGALFGDPNCMFRVAKAYENGELHISKNMQHSIRWYTLASELEQIDAMYHLAQFRYMGVENVLERNEKEAYDLALRSASKGHCDAAFLVGEYIENGIGIKKSPLHALWWYNIAKFLGHERAYLKVDELRKVVNINSKTGLSPSGCRMF